MRFTRELIRFSKSIELLQSNRFWTATSHDRRGDISWHGTEPGLPDWTHESRVLAFTLEHPDSGRDIHVILNADSREMEFELPSLPVWQALGPGYRYLLALAPRHRWPGVQIPWPDRKCPGRRSHGNGDAGPG